MPQAVRFDRYGGPEVLHVVDVEPPQPGEGEVSPASTTTTGCASTARSR
jgi:hypothetical protein